jgi:hypothetical protein
VSTPGQRNWYWQQYPFSWKHLRFYMMDGSVTHCWLFWGWNLSYRGSHDQT